MNLESLFFQNPINQQKARSIILRYPDCDEKLILYELVHYIQQNSSESPSKILDKEIKNSSLLFENNVFSEIRKVISEESQFLEQPIEVEDGVIQCSKCKSYKTVSYAKQTRASDEGTSVFVSCAVCKHKFRL